MKKILIAIGLILLCGCEATKYVGHKFDPKMAFDEVGYDHGDLQIYNWETEFGVELESIRFRMSYEEAEAIEYRKWTGGADWIVRANRFNFFAGAEYGAIYRHGWHGSLTAGLVGEVDFRVWDELYLMSDIKWYKSESQLDRYGKEMRWRVMTGIKYKFK